MPMIEKLELALWKFFGQRLKLSPQKATLLNIILSRVGSFFAAWVEKTFGGSSDYGFTLFIGFLYLGLCTFPLLLAFWFLAYICKKHKTIKLWHSVVLIFAVIHTIVFIINIFSAVQIQTNVLL